jgi:alpha-amylase
MLMPGSAPIVTCGGAATPTAPLAIGVNVPQEGRYILQAKLSNGGARPGRLYVKVDYLGPAESALF